jgi:hypothetical protein
MSNAQARMLVHEKSLMTQMNKTLLPGISVTPTAGSVQESAERSGASTSSATEPPSKRSRTESPLINTLFDEDRIVSALQKDVDMNVQERAFQLEKEKLEFQMIMKEREQELKNKEGFMDMAAEGNDGIHEGSN